ncbi:hypothetical protein LX32DRAFT_89596 [Colletotrichum zoysiae]|uniref:Uncharacterized protein n=1 Tax=Colletotrichum zoysiae TaxID=1216348 RepID=A0AAD9HQN9_9PEZI|nr:hypothetical protein LX32DRAFT_89596 [Colletotrichum zoysiae]
MFSVLVRLTLPHFSAETLRLEYNKNVMLQCTAAANLPRGQSTYTALPRQCLLTATLLDALIGDQAGSIAPYYRTEESLIPRILAKHWLPQKSTVQRDV